LPAKIVKAPIITESPINIECKVKNIVELGVHHMFISEVVNVSADDKYMDENGAFNLAQAKPLVYNHGHYFGLGEKIGKFGWSVEKKKIK
jgi:flavin reductase (DIM6/NTAB) family NADH-FMN oxidoreductase RutF